MLKYLCAQTIAKCFLLGAEDAYCKLISLNVPNALIYQIQEYVNLNFEEYVLVWRNDLVCIKGLAWMQIRNMYVVDNKD